MKVKNGDRNSLPESDGHQSDQIESNLPDILQLYNYCLHNSFAKR